MSIYEASQHDAQNIFRANTTKLSTMAGAMAPSFRCACCGEFKRAAGRVPVIPGSPKYGYIAESCLTVEMRGYAGHQRDGRGYGVALRDMLKVLIKSNAMTCYDMALKCQREHSTVITVIKKLKAAGLVHIDSWLKTPGRTGPMQAMYVWGEGKDAKKPERDTVAEKCQRYRNKHRGVHHSQLVKGDQLMNLFFGAR